MKVVWMYHDIMDLYGDKGNMMVLKKRCLDRGIPFELDTCGIGEKKDLSEYDQRIANSLVTRGLLKRR